MLFCVCGSGERTHQNDALIVFLRCAHKKKMAATTTTAPTNAPKFIQGDFGQFLAAIRAGKLRFDAKDASAELIVIESKLGMVNVTFTAFGGQLMYCDDMRVGRWVVWQAAAAEAGFTFSD